MESRTGARRKPPKRVDAADLDELLYLHAQSMFGDAPPAVPGEDTEIDLGGYSVSQAFDLWCAWKDHHVMAQRGGYLDQPRRWQRMIHAMNARFAPQYAAAKDEHLPDADGSKDDDGDVLVDLLGQSSPFDPGDSRPSWERFRD